MSDLQVVSFKPEPDQYAWTFGGAAPAMRIRTPAVLEVFTEDCFAGRVRAETDLVSQVCEFPFLNPQTGPFYIEDAAPGGTLRCISCRSSWPAPWGASTTVPLFGALTGTHLTALLNDPLPEVVWLWQLDAAAHTCRFAARRSSSSRWTCRCHRCTAPWAWPRRIWRSAARSYLTRSAGTWTPRRCGPGSPATWASTFPVRCSRWATGTPGRARARRAASRWSVR